MSIQASVNKILSIGALIASKNTALQAQAEARVEGAKKDKKPKKATEKKSAPTKKATKALEEKQTEKRNAKEVTKTVYTPITLKGAEPRLEISR